MNQFKAGSLLFPMLLCAGLQTVGAEPTPLWTVNFDSIGSVPQNAISSQDLSSGRVGSGVILSMSSGEARRTPAIAKFDGYGTPIWFGQNASVGGTITPIPKVRVLSDGSAIVMSDAIYRYLSNGQVAWAASIPSPAGGEIVEVGDVLFLAPAGGYEAAVVIDRESGRTLETRTNADFWPRGAALAAAGNDALYSAGTQISRVRLNPLRIEWSVSVEILARDFPCCGAIRLVADDSGAYLVRGSVVAKVSPSDGSVLWSQTIAPEFFVPEFPLSLALDPSNPADLLAIGRNFVTSIARSDGAHRWTHVSPAVISAFEASGDTVVLVGNTDPDSPAVSNGMIEYVQRNDGVLVGRQTVSGSPNTTSSVHGVAVAGDRIVASGVQCGPGQAPELCDLVIWHGSVDGGAVSMTKPSVRQSVQHAGSAGDGISTVAAALVATATGQRILVRRIRDSDGVVLWETSMPASLANAPGRVISEFTLRLTRTASSDVVIAFGRQPNINAIIPIRGDTVVAKLDGSNGSLQWQRSLLDPSGGYTDTSVSTFQLETDSSGNVFVSVHEANASAPYPPWPTPNRRELRKYSAATGEVLLRVPFPPAPPNFSPFDFRPVGFQISGDVAFSQEAPLPQIDGGASAIDTTTGNVLWRIPAPYMGYPYLSEGSSVFSAEGLSSPSPQIRLRRFEATTGNAEWESTYSDPSDASYAQPVILRGPDNALVVSSLSRMSSNATNLLYPYTARMLRVDGANGSITWVNRFENGPLNAYSIPRPLFGINGVIFALQPTSRASSSAGAFLIGLAESDGTFQGTSVLGFENSGLLQLPTTTFGIQGPAANDGMIVRRSTNLPGQPARFSLDKLPLPGPFAGGSLRANLATTATASGTQRTASFRFDVVNDGSVSADAVESVVALPTRAIIDSVSCTLAGSPCEVESTARYIRKLGDIGIGERLVLTGTVRFNAFLPVGASIQASAFTTTGLVEMDMQNNMFSIELADVLFRSGFDQ